MLELLIFIAFAMVGRVILSPAPPGRSPVVDDDTQDPRHSPMDAHHVTDEAKTDFFEDRDVIGFMRDTPERGLWDISSAYYPMWHSTDTISGFGISGGMFDD